MTATSLPSIKVLLMETIESFKLRWKPLVILQLIMIGLVILSVIVFALLIGGGAFLGSNLDPSVLGGVAVVLLIPLVLGLIYLTSLFATAQLIVFREQKLISWKEALRDGKPFLWKYFLTMLLLSILVAIGFILLIIPGIILAVYWSLVMPLLVTESLWGWNALKRSKELVSDKWKAVFIRHLAMFGLAICFMLGVGILTGAMSATENVFLLVAVQIVQTIFNMVFGMLVLAYTFVLYRHLKTA